MWLEIRPRKLMGKVVVVITQLGKTGFVGNSGGERAEGEYRTSIVNVAPAAVLQGRRAPPLCVHYL